MITNQPKWKIVEYSRSQIIKAGKTIKKGDAPEQEAAQATKIIDNWRAAHAFPMHVIYMHLRRMAASHSDIIVAERLKRLDSIVNKLKREPSMSLWTIDRDLKKKDLEEMAGVSHYVMNKLTHGDNVTTDVLCKVCKALNCTVDDIMEMIDE